MIDVVYPLANQSKRRDDFELRFSLRSLALQPWVRNLYLIGHCPRWIDRNTIIHIECKEVYQNNKDACIINKILLACYDQSISSKFVVNSDDQYFLKLIDPIEDLVPMKEPLKGIDKYHNRSNGNNWHRRVCDTVHWCNLNKYPNWVFQSHVPYIVDRRDYPLAMCKIPWGWGNGFTTHIYFNLTCEGQPVIEPKERTVRIKNQMPQKRIRGLLAKATFLNHNDSGLGPGMMEYLKQRFPVPSRWERV